MDKERYEVITQIWFLIEIEESDQTKVCNHLADEVMLVWKRSEMVGSLWAWLVKKETQGPVRVTVGRRGMDSK